MRILIAILFLGVSVSCAAAESFMYALYRTGLDVPSQRHDESLRIHIATFDAQPLKDLDGNAKYNYANCEFARHLFDVAQPHYRGINTNQIKFKYWCEKGQFKP